MSIINWNLPEYNHVEFNMSRAPALSLPYKIIIKLEDSDLTPNGAISAGQYFSDALRRMQIASYSVDCYRDDSTLMIKFPRKLEE